MKLKGLILACLMIVSGSANATVVTPAIAGVVASTANASRRIAHNTNNSVNNALDNSTKVLVPCDPQYKGGGFFTASVIDRELTIGRCEEEKRKFERLNGVRYKFGKAVSYDNYRDYFYFELIEE